MRTHECIYPKAWLLQVYNAYGSKRRLERGSHSKWLMSLELEALGH